MENNEVKVENNGINEDVLELMSNDEVFKVISDPKEMNRAMLNALCELYSTVKELRANFDALAGIISTLSADRVSEFCAKAVREEHKKSAKVTKFKKV